MDYFMPRKKRLMRQWNEKFPVDVSEVQIPLALGPGTRA